jgi:signal transduction histidine kinase/CheY-like chemotaxis protein
MAQDLAARAALAVDNARLYGEAREAADRLALLAEASGRLTSSLEQPAVLSAILDVSGRLVAADAYAVWRLRPGDDGWEIAHSAGLSCGYLRSASRIVGVGRQMPDRPVVAEDARGTALLEERRRFYEAEGIESLLALPLRVHGEVSGTLVFYYRRRRAFDETSVRVATALANLAGAALGTAELYQRQSELRRRAEEADRRKDEFLAMLAHEQRNPLAPVRSAAHILAQDAGLGPQARWATEVLGRQVGQLTRLVDDLLDVSRIARGKINLRVGPVELAAVVARAVETSRPLLDARRQQLTVSLPPGPLRLRGDEARMAQALANLLNNAAKYTDEGGRIGLTAEAEAGEFVVRVRDTGCGIAPELLPRVFEAFTQADRSLDRAQGGLGIGLAIVRGLVELHGGTVEARSQGPGKGSEFVVRLPAPAEADLPAPEAPARDGPAPPRRVLVVDDNRDAADSIALLLALWGHEAAVAYDGPTAVALARECRPEVVLLDLGLPGMTGYDVAARLRAEPALSCTRLLALTGYGAEEDRRRTQAARFDGHLLKPVDPDLLREALAAPEGAGADGAAEGRP